VINIESYSHFCIKQLPLISGQLKKARKILPLITVNLTSIKRSRSAIPRSQRVIFIVFACIERSLCLTEIVVVCSKCIVVWPASKQFCSFFSSIPRGIKRFVDNSSDDRSLVSFLGLLTCIKQSVTHSQG